MEMCQIKNSLLYFLILIFISCQNQTEASPEVAKNKITAQTVDESDSANIIEQIRVQKDSNYCYADYSVGPKFGFKNREGKVIIIPKFDFAGDFYGDYAPVVLGNKHGFCDTSGNIIFSLEKVKFFTHHNELSGEPFLFGNNEGYFMVKDKNEKFGFVNNQGKLIIKCQFESVEAFNEGLAAFTENDKMGFIDSLGNKVIRASYERTYFFSEGLAAVRLENDKVGYINKKNEMVIPAIYYYGYAFSEGLAVVSKSQEYNNFYYINKAGETEIKGPFDEADSFKNGEALVFKRGKCRYIDKTGTQLRTAGTDCFQGC